MRTRQRLSALKQWTYERLCQGRTMKAPAEGMDITQIVRQEPQVFLAWQPTRPDMTGLLSTDPLSVGFFDNRPMKILQVNEDMGMVSIALVSFDPKAVGGV